MGEAETGPDESTAGTVELDPAALREYWRRNVKLIIGLFVIWFLVSFLAAILIANTLNTISLGQIPLSFWFAQQGSIIVFVLLIFIYVWQMNKLDREFGVED